MSAEPFLDRLHHWTDGTPRITVLRLAAPQLYHAAWTDASGSGLALRHIWDGADAAVTLSFEPRRVQACADRPYIPATSQYILLHARMHACICCIPC